MLKKQISMSLLILLTLSCSVVDHDKSFYTKSIPTSTVDPLPIPSGYSNSEKILTTSSNNSNLLKLDSTVNKGENIKTSFEDYPSSDLDTIPGQIVVIYKNSEKVRYNSKNIKSLNQSTNDAVSNLLKKYELKSGFDSKPNWMSDEENDTDELNASTKLNIDVPNRKSIHYYYFDKNADTKKIASEFRKLPFVRTAYPVLKIKEDVVSTTLLSRQNNGNIANPSNGAISYPYTSFNIPNDQYFHDPVNFPESGYWWWFRRHKLFHALDFFNSSSAPPPTIAVIDTGFDTSTQAADRPYYLPGYSISAITDSSGNIIGSNKYPGNEVDPVINTSSHGTLVSSVLASPRNSSGLCGAMPTASILPIRIADTPSIGAAIEEAANTSNVDVINICLSLAGTSATLPLISDPVIRSKIIYAISTKNKPVVITAGNSGINLDLPIYKLASLDVPGLIMVGGSQNNSSQNRSEIWSSSNYGSFVDLTAAASNVLAPKYNPSTGVRSLVLNTGTSVSAPMVSAVVGMMKKIAYANGSVILTPQQLESMITFSADLGRYSNSSQSSYYLGKNLSNTTATNFSGSANIRDLNAFNALIIAKNSYNYQGSNSIITRVFNVDDIGKSSYSNISYASEPYQNDALYGISGLTSGTPINFSTDNTSNGGYAYGYQVYRNKVNVFEKFDGISGLIGAENNAYKVSGTYASYPYTY